MSKTPVSFSRKNFIQSFKRKNPSIKIDDKQIHELIDFTGKAIADILLTDGEVKLGNRLGVLMIRKFRPKGKGGSFTVVVDHTKSREQKKTVYQFNDHTDGYIYKFIWDKHRCQSISDKHMWVFKPIRNIKRLLAPLIRGKIHDYPIMIHHSKPTNVNEVPL